MKHHGIVVIARLATRLLRQRVATSAIVAACAGCSAGADGSDDPSELERVQQPSLCGTNDMQDVEAYDGSLGPSVVFVGSKQAPVGNLKWRNDLASRYANPGNTNGVRWCTGTLIAKDLMITAGHCFDPDANGWTWPRVNGTGTPISAAVGASELQVDFNYQNDPSGNPRTLTTFEVAELVEYRLGALDFAVIRLDGPAGDSFGSSGLSAFELHTNDPVTIIQHPAGSPKKIHAGSVASLSGSIVRYATADTLGGSSGSGVLSELTGMVSAVHTNGGCNPDGSGSNVGVALVNIAAVSPTVKQLAMDSSKLAALY